MDVQGFQLTYCTNIHPGETWEGTFNNLKLHVPQIRQKLAGDAAFGIGLRLSNEASLELHQAEKLREFEDWLKKHGCYVFTLNGFPYGGFHRTVVKDQVHFPDWSSAERKEYTARLFDILEILLPRELDGGISTSPLSYKFWHDGDQEIEEVKRQSTLHLVEIAAKLYRIRQQAGKLLHLDIEPEPDGLLENTQDVLDFYRDWLVPLGQEILSRDLNLNAVEAEAALKEHIRICYDVCHFAVVYEHPHEVFAAFGKEGIKVGKVQLSAALKVKIPEPSARADLKTLLLPFAESTYLHQVVGWHGNGRLSSYRDLPMALNQLSQAPDLEWRIHFHVPVFLENYGKLSSTQADILQVLEILRAERISNHLEVETYTWEVLPEEINLNLTQSITRELQWVIEHMKR